MSAVGALRMRNGYRRADSETNNSTTVNNIRNRFESTTDSYSPPEIGLAFGVKKTTPCSTPGSEAPSPSLSKKHGSEFISALRSPKLHKPAVRQLSEPDAVEVNTNTPVTPIDKYKKAIMKPNTLNIANGAQAQRGKHTPCDEPSLKGLHNTGIVSSRKQQITSPILSPTTPVPCVKGSKTKLPSESVLRRDNKDNITTPTSDRRVTTPFEDKRLTTPIAELNGSRHSVAESAFYKPAASKQPAKAFWRNISVEADTPSSPDTATKKTDSVIEPGMDYAKLRKKDLGSKDKSAPSKANVAPKVSSKEVQLTASNLKKVSDSLADYKSGQRLNSLSDESRTTGTSLSKSPSVSSTCSSMDSSEIDYINGAYSHKWKRRDTKPPQSIVARRTQLFEKSMDEINSVLEEAEAYNKIKDVGFGTAFTSAAAQSTQSKPKMSPVSQPKTADKKAAQSRLDGLINNNTKLANKNPPDTKPAITTDKNKNHLNCLVDSKPLPALPKTAAPSNCVQAPPATSSKPKPKGPPKPPRTFEHSKLTPASSNEMVFDPVVFPRQAGDGEENHDYERHVSCESPHVYTSVTLPLDTRPYATTTSIDTRPYTSLTTAGGSGGDDSVGGSENPYDTLGRASVASSYEHYDTISQSELDSDVSRPPTLPRRPSNLHRHRPVSTAFSHLDISGKTSTTHNQLNKVLPTPPASQTIKETSPTSPSPTKTRAPFKLKYLLPKAFRKTDELRKASSMADLLDDRQSVYDAAENRPVPANNAWSSQNSPAVVFDEAGYALPDIKGPKRQADSAQPRLGEPQQIVKPQPDKATEKIRLKLNQAFSALRKPAAAAATQASDGEDEEKPPDPEMLEERLKHCTTVKEHAIYASVDHIKGFMTRVYAQLYDYAVIVALRKNPDTNVYEPCVKYKFPPQVKVEQTTVPQFCYPDAHIWHKCTDYKSEAFSFVLTDVTGTRQYGYCRRILPPDLNNVPRTPEVICVVSPLNAPKLYSQVLDEVEKRRMQSSLRAEEFLQAVYGRPLPSPGQSVTIRAMNVYEEAESLVFTRSPDSQREGIDYECLLNTLSVSQIIKIFASILLERKIIFIAEKLSILSSCVHAFVSLIYPFSWQHTFIPLLPPNLIDVVCAPTPYIVGLLSSNAHLLHSLDDEMEEVLVVDLDNHKFLQRMGDEKSILPKKLHRALITALEMAKSESQTHRNAMVAEAFLRFFLETTGSFNQCMIHVPGAGRQFQKEEFVCNASNVPSIMVFLQWFTETQMFEVYTTERENDRNVISGTFEERVYEFQSEDHGELFSDNNKRFKKFKLFGKNKKK